MLLCFVSLGESWQHLDSLIELFLRVARSADLSNDCAIAALVLTSVAEFTVGSEHQYF